MATQNHGNGRGGGFFTYLARLGEHALDVGQAGE